MKRSLTVAAAVVAAALLLAGCSSSTGGASATGSDNATIFIGSLYEPQNLSNTQGGGQGVTEAFNGNVYEGLYKLTDDGKVVPLLAKDSVVSGDGLTYTITLRDGVTFHSGKKLTSADVKSSVEAVTAPDSKSARKSSFTVIKDIATPDDKTVVFTYFTDATAENNALLTGAVDLITSVQSPDALAQFKGNKDFTVSEGTSTTKELLAFNDKVAPFNNTLVRKAVYSAIDTKKLLSSIWGEYGTLIGSMVPPTDTWYEDLTGVNPYDLNLARQELAQAGFKDGFTFTLDTPSYDPHPAVAEFLQSQLAEVGITVKINTISADEWYTKVFQQHDFQATLQEHVNDRDVVWYGNPDFYWGYDNADVQKWVADAEQASSTDEQTALLKKVNEQIAADAASAWLYLYPQIVVAASNVSGYGVNGLNSQFFAYNIVNS